MPSVGEPAPDFTLPDQDGRPVHLADYRGSTVVIYFYPKDDTPGCTTEACGFRDARADWQEAGAVVLGISPDSVASHRKFATKFDLPFPLLADTEKAVCQAYDVWKEKSMYGKSYMGVERSTFVIGPDGLVRHVFPKVKVNGHVAAVLKAIEAG